MIRSHALFIALFIFRVSLFFISRMDGVIEAWDLLQQQNEPVLTVKVCDEPINCIRSHESGNLSVGSQKGVMYLIEVSENMKYSSKNDKPLFTAMLERESKREKILEGKLREIKLKNKTTAQKVEEETEELRQSRLAGLDRACNQAKADYFKVVERIRDSRSPDKSKGRKLLKCSQIIHIPFQLITMTMTRTRWRWLLQQTTMIWMVIMIVVLRMQDQLP